mmetsp:Transcript_31293/g.108175  ORF Transcript_31293/g.108175 Transcript_31293/m.108175 type:complete len:392 (+) Transcript_31293:47-1222(+)
MLRRSAVLAWTLLRPGAAFARTTSALHSTKKMATAAAPTFGGSATTAKDELLRQALALFVDDEAAQLKGTTGGVNNIVQYVDTSKGDQYVLRIYNNGCDTPRVLFEHAVVDAVHKLESKLSFQIPKFVPSLATAQTAMVLPSGAMACVCDLIPGSLPKTSDPLPIGRATGELLGALGAAVVAVECPTAPFHQIYKAHAGVGGDKAAFLKYIQDRPQVFEECKSGMATLLAELARLDARIVDLVTAGLPTQLIHADLHYDNVLTDPEGTVTGLLDFEFACVDWRAMEPAVSLTKYVGAEDPLPLLVRFLEGFSEHAVLTQAECEALPDLINLRVLHNVVYFVGRAMTGEDTIDALTTRADMYAARTQWVNANAGAITACVADLMKAKDPDWN